LSSRHTYDLHILPRVLCTYLICKLGSIGCMVRFDGLKGWKLYEERLKQYFLANGIKKERRVPVLLSTIESKSYKIVIEFLLILE